MKIPLPYYIFNKFDERSSIEQHARDMVVKQCGDRLLPIRIRRSVDRCIRCHR